MTPNERAALRNTDPVPPVWRWPTSKLVEPRERFRLPLSGEELGRRTIGLPAPRGILWLALWRHRDWSGACAS